MRIGFRFKWIPFVATVLLVALGIALGQWQDRRAAQKTVLEHKLALGNASAPLIMGPQPVAAADIELRRVVVSGQWMPEWTVYLDNRPYQGRAGLYVLTPLRIKGSNQTVLVNRGWLPRNTLQRDVLPPYATPTGSVTLEGVARLTAGHVMQLGTPPPLHPGAIVQNVALSQFSAASGWPLQPVLLEQTSSSPDLLLRDWPAPSLGVEKHRAYAFQWYALALMAFLFFVLTGFRRGSN